MARPLWSGSLSFGLVNVPVELRSAVRDRQLHFTQLNERTGRAIEVRRWCTKESKEVPWEEVAHGYELDDGRQVVLTDEELEAAQPRRTRTIDVEQFADLSELDPLLFDHPYLLTPAGSSEGTLRAYRLLHDVMEAQEKVAIGRFVLRSKQYLAAVRADGPLLSLTTLRFHDELRDPVQAGAPSATARSRPKPRAVRAAVALIDSLSGDFDPSAWRDRHRARLRRAIDRKSRGEKLSAPRRDAPADRASPDLMEALEASIARMAKA